MATFFLCLLLFCGTVLCCLFWFRKQLAEEMRSGCFTLFVLLPCKCRCSVILHHGDVNGSMSVIVVFPAHSHCFICLDFSLSGRSIVSSLFGLKPFYPTLTLFCNLVRSVFFSVLIILLG